ncbi:monooxygenase FAD-binding [Gloeothece citriformis PCC 7424]|uniref:Monooxygenase FAD-binding n=1 Tax=Gloeothece citriformis (strain PCC 7424) TaxID=65393 RepID=B7KAF1_GLOC7|nr:NAD(P)/FAD-dependent oxidoreductase [Gloeothece citriformis]ACK72925.1 monooxygenase FAD-binding [Gloeothece citriformis PCC 7424]
MSDANFLTEQDIYDVLVVGAGPVGLATAIGLRKRGIENILVIDQTRAFRPVGQVIDLLPNGLKALKSLDPQAYEAVKKAGIKIVNSNPPQDEKNSQNQSPRWVHKNLKGQTLNSFPLSYEEWFNKYGEGRISIPWYQLQTTLREQLPSDKVKANHRCINVVHEPELNCVRVDCTSNLEAEINPYAHWTEVKPDSNQNTQPSLTKSIRAKLVIGADGINSRVRQSLYNNSPYEGMAKPEYTGYAAVGCREVAELPEELFKEIEAHFLTDARILTLLNEENLSCVENPRMLLIQRQKNVLGYIIHLALPLELLKEESKSSLKKETLESLSKANFPHALTELVKLSPLEELYYRPYYIHRTSFSETLPFPKTAKLNQNNYDSEMSPPWSKGRVVLVGDAIHGMPPFLAQGANQGLEDALALTTVIANMGDKNHWDDTQINQAFTDYESLRRSLIGYIQQAVLNPILFYSPQDWQNYHQKVFNKG